MPPLCRHLCGDFPYRVVVAVGGGIVEERDVALHPRGIRPEDVGGEVIVPGIETELDDIARRKIVAPAEPRTDLGRDAGVAIDCHVKIAIVVCDPHDGAFARRLHVVGIFLDEVFDRDGIVPGFVVQPAIDPGSGAWDPEGAQLLSCLFGHVRL